MDIKSINPRKTYEVKKHTGKVVKLTGTELISYLNTIKGKVEAEVIVPTKPKTEKP